jgi:hypothetical protein
VKLAIVFTFSVLLLGFAFESGGQDEPIVHDPQKGDGTPAEEGVAGRVTDASGDPVSGALVNAKSLDEVSPPIPELAIVTDANGHYVWRLLPGNYEISILAAGFHSATKEVLVEPNQQSRLDFTLERVR